MDKGYLFKALEAECCLQVASGHLARQPRGVAAIAQMFLYIKCVMLSCCHCAFRPRQTSNCVSN